MAITNNIHNWIRLSVETYGFPLDSRLVEFICLCSISHGKHPKELFTHPLFLFLPHKNVLGSKL